MKEKWKSEKLIFHSIRYAWSVKGSNQYVSKPNPSFGAVFVIRLASHFDLGGYRGVNL